MEESVYPQTLKVIQNQLSLDDVDRPLHLYLESHKLNNKIPYLSDLAQLEFLLYQSFSDPQYEFKLDMDGLLLDLEQTPQSVVLEPSDSLYLITSSFPIQKIWLDLRDGKKVNVKACDKSTYYYVINSVAGSTGAFLVSKIIYDTLLCLKSNRYSLDELVTKLFSTSKPDELEEVLRQILKSGWIQNYQIITT